MINTGIKEDDIVSIDYVARTKDNRIVLSTKSEGILTFQVGKFPFLKGIYSAVIGMRLGEVKTELIKAKDAFGDRDESLVTKRDELKLHLTLDIGQKIYDKENRRFFTVIEKNNGVLILDANHPLAGKDLTFTIKVLSIKHTNFNLPKILNLRKF